ncbi:polyamine aminopropyltransferase [candidate division CSSED10-310 bacterium]|uniref:Polyamine aminopropyltransferase n=1 Tax=candidate division CSSED10-310 bacterium TaxID=2855610 RepID=A0ABV6YX86_UNCC1
MKKPAQPPPASIIKLVLVLSMIFMGACGLVYEYVLSVLGNYLMGTSYEEIFIIIGVMMFAMGIGSLVQRIVAGNLFEKFLLLEVLLGLLGGFSATIVYMLFAVTPAYKVILYCIALSIGVMIGMEIPLLIRINQEYSESLRVNLSEILCMDYIGSLIGALLFTYVLLTHFTLAKISFVLGLTNILIGLVSLFVFRYFLDRFGLLLLVTLVSLGSICFGFYKSADWSRWAEQKYYNDPIVFSETTPYQHLTLTKGRREINFFINGHLQFSSSDEYIYHELLVFPPLVLSATAEKILILGGGDGLALREVLKFPSVRRVDLVDLDPGVIALASHQPDLIHLNQASFSDARVRIHGSTGVSLGETIEVVTRNWRSEFALDSRLEPVAEVNLYLIDADLFVRTFDDLYDCIIIDLPDPSTLELAKLYSFDFYRLLINNLKPEGFLSLQATSPFYSKNTFLSIGKTLREAGLKALPYHENVPSFGEWGWYLCWRHDLTAAQIRKKLDSITDFPTTQFLTPRLLPTCFIFPKNMLQTEKEINFNSKMNPVLWAYYRNDWKYGPD